jgi:hypothetical protein
MSRIPWVGLAALVLMFAIPFLPSWLFDGPRTVRHWPRRHVCGACDAPWTADHVCEIGPASHPGSLLRAQIQRLDTGNDLEVFGHPPESS